jgi:hypothetical protein
MIGRFLDAGDLQKLHRMLIKKKPPAPSLKVRKGRTSLEQRSGAKSREPSGQRRATNEINGLRRKPASAGRGRG